MKIKAVPKVDGIQLHYFSITWRGECIVLSLEKTHRTFFETIVKNKKNRMHNQLCLMLTKV